VVDRDISVEHCIDAPKQAAVETVAWLNCNVSWSQPRLMYPPVVIEGRKELFFVSAASWMPMAPPALIYFRSFFDPARSMPLITALVLSIIWRLCDLDY
jgi:hypothetical protein